MASFASCERMYIHPTDSRQTFFLLFLKKLFGLYENSRIHYTLLMTLTLLNIAGAVALLLWATYYVQAKITAALGATLKSHIALNTENRFEAFATGIGLTALLQSSSATTIMAATFLKSGMLALPASLALIMGADLGSTILAQILSFDLGWLGPLVLLGAIITNANMPKHTRKARLAQAVIGIGLILLSLTLIRESATPLRESELLIKILQSLSAEPILAILLAAIFTLITCSSLGSILFFAALAGKGLIVPELGLYLIVGANLGSAALPILTTCKDGPTTLRMTLGAGAIKALIAIPFTLIASIIMTKMDIGADTSRLLVTLHTGFSLSCALFTLPLINSLANALETVLPDDPQGHQSPLKHLDEHHLTNTTLALTDARRETLRLADMLETMLSDSFEAMKDNDTTRLNAARLIDNDIDTIYSEIKLYLSRLHRTGLDEAEEQQLSHIMSFATNLEHCGDILQHSLSDTLKKKIDSQANFSEEGWEEINIAYQQMIHTLQRAQSLFITPSEPLAQELIADKRAMKRSEFASRKAHFQRLSAQKPETMATSLLHVDLMRDFGRINSHLASVAYHVLQ